MSDNTPVILFNAAAKYASEVADTSIREDVRIAFVAGAEWQWQRSRDVEAEMDQMLAEDLAATLATKETEIQRLRKALEWFEDATEAEFKNHGAKKARAALNGGE